ncbi:MAG: hypothetical protein EBU90_21465 [Proteobacteria bacterium]|nr:hypothetical protein [Pseudomonadota bacterium]NBP15054.1 hypothetical protein [bacterium]
MRDRIGNFSKNKFINPQIDSGIHSLRNINNANETGYTSQDPYLANVEFIFKFEEPNGSRVYVNSIPNDKYLYISPSLTDKSGTTSPGYISYTRSKFGNGSYFNNTSHPTSSFGVHGLFYTDIVSLGYEDFTLECWVNFTTLSQNNSSIFWLNGRGDTGYGGVVSGYNFSGGFNLYVNSSGVLILSAAGQTLSSTTTPFVVNTWHHVALVRKNGIIKVFVDGILKMSSVANANILATTGAESGYCFGAANLKLFGIRTSNSFYGDEARFTRNVARYWDNFTPPTSFPVPTKITNQNVIALMKFDEPDEVKNHAGRSKDLVKTPTLVTNDKKFGVSSLQPNSYCSFHQLDPSGRIGTSDFNISCWIKPTANNGSNGYPIFSLNKKLSLFIGGSQWATYNKSGITAQDSPFDGRLTLTYNNRVSESSLYGMPVEIVCQTPKNTISLNVWQHILVSRKNNVYRIFVDGVLKATGIIYKLTSSVTPSSAITGLAYGNNTYVYMTTGSSYGTSTDFSSWTLRSMPSNLNWQGLIYANNQFTTIGYNSNTIAHSADGISWTTATLPTYSYNSKQGVQTRNAGWFRVAYGNNTYVAIGNSIDGNVGKKIITSSNGTTWTTRSDPGGNDFRDLVFINGEFLILGNTRIWRSSDGTSWTSTNNSTTAFNSIAYGNNKYVAFNGSSISTSTNLSAFTTVTLPRKTANYPSDLIFHKVVFLNNKFYLFSTKAGRSVNNYPRNSTDIYNTYFLESDDGVNWNYGSLPGANPYPIVKDNQILGFSVFTNRSVGGSGRGIIVSTAGADIGYNSYVLSLESFDIDRSYLIIGGYGGNNSGDANREDQDYYTIINETTVTRSGSSPNEIVMPTNHLTGNLNNRWGEFRFEGLIDEFIIDKNTGIDSNFTPPTESLAAPRYSY